MNSTITSHCNNIVYIAIITVTLIFTPASCNKNSSGETKYNKDFSTLMPDTLVNETSEALIDTTARIPDSKKIEDLVGFMERDKNAEKYAEGIIRLIAEESPEYAYKLLCNKYDEFIIVDKSQMKVMLFDKYGRTIKSYGMACAKNYGTKHKKGDSRTPEGFFSVEGIYDSTDWLYTDDNGVTSQVKGQFGPRFIRIKIPNTSQIGIHGTCAPWSIGHRASHGCIRLKNENILELVELVEPGIPVIIVPGARDMAQNKVDDINIPWIPSSHSAKKPAIRALPQPKNDNSERDTMINIATDSVTIHTQAPAIVSDSVSIDQSRSLEE